MYICIPIYICIFTYAHKNTFPAFLQYKSPLEVNTSFLLDFFETFIYVCPCTYISVIYMYVHVYAYLSSMYVHVHTYLLTDTHRYYHHISPVIYVCPCTYISVNIHT